jgi:hypothetical protein
MSEKQAPPIADSTLLRDLPFYSAMVEALIEHGEALLTSAYHGVTTEELLDGFTEVTNRIVNATNWLMAAHKLTGKAVL